MYFRLEIEKDEGDLNSTWYDVKVNGEIAATIFTYSNKGIAIRPEEDFEIVPYGSTNGMVLRKKGA